MYLLLASTGDRDSYEEWIVAVYVDCGQAEAHLARLRAFLTIWQEEVRELKKQHPGDRRGPPSEELLAWALRAVELREKKVALGKATLDPDMRAGVYDDLPSYSIEQRRLFRHFDEFQEEGVS